VRKRSCYCNKLITASVDTGPVSRGMITSGFPYLEALFWNYCANVIRGKILYHICLYFVRMLLVRFRPLWVTRMDIHCVSSKVPVQSSYSGHCNENKHLNVNLQISWPTDMPNGGNCNWWTVRLSTFHLTSFPFPRIPFTLLINILWMCRIAIVTAFMGMWKHIIGQGERIFAEGSVHARNHKRGLHFVAESSKQAVQVPKCVISCFSEVTSRINALWGFVSQNYSGLILSLYCSMYVYSRVCACFKTCMYIHAYY
jgi:hypothetical protein